MKSKKVLLVLVLFGAVLSNLSAKKMMFFTEPEPNVIKILSYSDEISYMVDLFREKYPDCSWDFDIDVVSWYEGYESQLEDELYEDSETSPDIFLTQADNVLKYTKTSYSKFLLPLEQLGMNVDFALKASEIAPYTVQIGSNSNNEVVGLSYQTCGGVFIYRRSIAKEVFGTDDPKEIGKIIGGGTGNWDKFLEAAEVLKNNDVRIVSTVQDIWRPVLFSADKSWIYEKNGDSYLYIDPKREAYFDIARTMLQNEYVNTYLQWETAWFDDLKDKSEDRCFGYFGPAWMINYVMAPNCSDYYSQDSSYGDWAICSSPSGFMWGGSWLHVNNRVSKASDEKKEVIKKFIEFVCLNIDKESFMYKYGNGDIFLETDTVASAVVMRRIDYTLSFLDEQDAWVYFIEADNAVNADCISVWDEQINSIWLSCVMEYAEGSISRSKAIEKFKSEVRDNYNIFVEE